MDKIIEITAKNYNEFDLASIHVVQSSIWAEFKKVLNSKTMLLAEIENNIIIHSWLLEEQIRGGFKSYIISESTPPTASLIKYLKELGKREKLISFKFEPLLLDEKQNRESMLSLGLTKGSDYFLKNTFILDLNRFLTEDDMFSNFSKSTRRNIRIAEKKGILTHLYEYDNTNESNNESHVETFLSIQRTTVKRHNFAVHPDDYYKTLFKVFKNNMIFLEAEYQGEIIASIVLFVWKDKCYYPYGASLHKYIETKSANLLLYTALKYAYNKKLSSFNFWGALTNKNAMNEKNPLYGVHMFKKGYGGELNEYIGAYDLVINPYIYYELNLLHRIRGIIRKWKRVLER